MTLDEWRKNEALVKWAFETFRSPEGRVFLDMLNENHPKNFQLVPMGATDSDKSTALGRIYGYDNALNNIEEAGRPNIKQQMPAESWGTERTNKPKR